jgi:hypothetical protein
VPSLFGKNLIIDVVKIQHDYKLGCVGKYYNIVKLCIMVLSQTSGSFCRVVLYGAITIPFIVIPDFTAVGAVRFTSIIQIILLC